MRVTNEQGEKWKTTLALVVAVILTVLIAAGVITVRFPAADANDAIQPDIEKKNDEIEELAKPPRY